MKPFCYHSFDLRQLVSFAEIARTGSFRQAAKVLHIAQPALSRQIKQLEAALGICLFDRAPRRLDLTIEGRELAGRLPALFSQIEHLTDAVKGANAGGTSHLRIGDGGALTTEVIAPALRRLRQEWPNLWLSDVLNRLPAVRPGNLNWGELNCSIETAAFSACRKMHRASSKKT